EAVAVPADARDHALDEAPRSPLLGATEAERVEHGDGAGAHGEDVAQDAADPGGSALERLDERRVVMALDLEGEREVIAQVHDPRVLAGPLQDVRGLRRQGTQEHARMLVGAMLGPEGGEQSQLGEGRLAAEPLGLPSFTSRLSSVQ